MDLGDRFAPCCATFRHSRRPICCSKLKHIVKHYKFNVLILAKAIYAGRSNYLSAANERICASLNRL